MITVHNFLLRIAGLLFCTFPDKDPFHWVVHHKLPTIYRLSIDNMEYFDDSWKTSAINAKHRLDEALLPSAACGVAKPYHGAMLVQWRFRHRPCVRWAGFSGVQGGLVQFNTVQFFPEVFFFCRLYNWKTFGGNAD